jgi:RNA polymerase sigma-70 factor (ECF subfamily)
VATLDVFSFFSGTRQARKNLEAHRTRLYRIAYAWTHNASLADDLVQETLAKALTKSTQLRDPNASSAWLYSILANCYADHFRRLKTTEEIDEETLIHEATPETESGRQQVVGRVRAAIAKLSEGQRQVITLVDLEGLSYVEVAQALDIPIGTVMSRLCRARIALRDYLQELMVQPTMDAVKPGVLIRRIK